MAHAFIMEFDGGTLDQYDLIMADMALDGRLPPGALFHAVGRTADGIMVCDVWETAEEFGAFAQEKIGPLSAKHGVGEPRMRDFEVDRIREGEHGEVGFFQVVTLTGLDAAGFNALDEQVTGGSAPDGCIYHASGPIGSDWMILDYWTSRAIHDTFIEEHVMPAMQAAGRAEPPAIEAVDAHNALTPFAIPH